jgi:hypothetical protein
MVATNEDNDCPRGCDPGSLVSSPLYISSVVLAFVIEQMLSGGEVSQH